VSSTKPFDLLVLGATVLGGTGGPRFRADDQANAEGVRVRCRC